MKILLLGATGRTGRHLLQQALGRGHTVHALVRDTSKVKMTHSNLVLVEGSPADKNSLGHALQGCEAILSALNVSRKNDWPWSPLRTPEDFLSSVMTNIIQLATKYNIQRIIVTSAWGAAETRQEVPGWFRWLIEHSNVKFPYVDHERQEKLLQQSSLRWTAVRPAGLTNIKWKKKIIVSFNKIPQPGLTISRQNLAAFMLDALEKDLYVQQMPVLSQK